MKKEVNYDKLNHFDPLRNSSTLIRENQTYKDFKMKRYYQALLLITAVISVVSLLFYRHEYNRLRYVLEVFNYFGKPSQETLKLNCTKESYDAKKVILHLDEPFSAWQRLNNDLYIYSSYAVSKNTIKTISYGKLSNLDMDCTIFFNGRSSPIAGQFSFGILGNTSDIPSETAYRGYILHCNYTENMLPVGVTYQQKGKEYKNDIPISPVKNQPKALTYNGSALCVAPPLNMPISQADMISFLNFHELIGMNHFIIYDYGIPSTFHEALKNIAQHSSSSWKFTYEVVPWNFPYREIHPNVIKNIIDNDCMLRTYNKVMYAATLVWEEFVVLKYHHAVSDLLLEFQRNKMIGQRYLIQSQTFCTQQRNSKKSKSSTPTIFRKTYTTPNALDANYAYVYRPHDTVNTNKVITLKTSTDLIVVNRYVFCNDYNANDVDSNKYEPSILRFAGDTLNSPIFRNFITGKLFKIE